MRGALGFRRRLPGGIATRRGGALTPRLQFTAQRRQLLRQLEHHLVLRRDVVLQESDLLLKPLDAFVQRGRLVWTRP